MESIMQKMQEDNKQNLRELFYKKANFVYYNVLNRVQNKNSEVVRLLTRQVFSEVYKIAQNNKTVEYGEDGIDHLFMERIDYYCGIYSKLLKSFYNPFGDDIKQKDTLKATDYVKENEIKAERLYSTEEKEADLRDDKVGMDSSIVLKEKVRRFHWSFIFLIPIIMLLLWAIAGILMGMKLIPNLDLGYLWFNKAFFSLF